VDENLNDKFTIRTIVISLALLSLLGLGGMIYLQLVNQIIPDPVNSLTSAAVGALAAMLAKTTLTSGGGSTTTLRAPGGVTATTTTPATTPATAPATAPPPPPPPGAGIR